VPSLSENKAIAIAKTYPSFNLLMQMLLDDSVTEKEKKAKLTEI